MKDIRFLIIALSAFFILFACSKNDLIDEDPQEEDDPSSIFIAVFGDIQYYTNSDYIHLYQESVDWIRMVSDEGKYFNCILHTGDITQGNSKGQYSCFYEATVDVAKKIPYFSMIGNHDYTWNEGNNITDRSSTHFNEYVKFPLSKQKVVAWFEKGRMENIVVENSIYGHRFDLLILEFGPREEVVEWADAYVKSHPEHNFILMNHEYLEKGGGRRTRNITAETQFANEQIITPEQLWNNLIKCNDNIRLVLCGHVGGLYALTIDANDYGREIPQIQHNIQSPDYRYDNWLMLWEFPIESDSANVCIYNTRTSQYYNDQEILFKFRYKDVENSVVADNKLSIE